MTSVAHQMDLNPVSPTNLLNPSPLYRELREHHPVHWSEEIRCWLVTRYDDVTDCFRNSRLSADRSKFYAQQLQGLGTDIAEGFLQSAREQMTMLDGTKHIRLRRMTNPGFTPQALDTTVPTIRRTMEMLLERVRPRGHMELVKEIAYQLPPLVIAEMLGVPPEERERFQQWAAPLAQFSSPSPTTDMVKVAKEASAATANLSEYLSRSIEERRRLPGDDMLSRMIHAQEEGNLTQEALIANSILLLTAGHLTTTDQISNSI
jgi:cytochrome P450